MSMKSDEIAERLGAFRETLRVTTISLRFARLKRFSDERSAALSGPRINAGLPAVAKAMASAVALAEAEKPRATP
jgi:hypothetical protein